MADPANDNLLTRGKFAMPVDAREVSRDWAERGFTCENFADPPGRAWNDFIHDTDELVTVIEGRLRLLLDGRHYVVGPGDELLIPKGWLHSVENIHAGTTRWLFGYG